MHAALPVNQTPQIHSNPLDSWANDFLQQQPLLAQELAINKNPQSLVGIQVNAPSQLSQYSSPGMPFLNNTMI